MVKFLVTMSLRCEISGETPTVPVVSPSSGCVFEKKLLQQYLEEHHNDPITKEPLTIDQCIEIKASSIVKPKPPSATSIPAVLKILQDEWDSCMLTSFSLKKNLQTTRQELSHALYQHDAACRVISRLTKESNTAREALATLKPQATTVQQTTHKMMDVDQQQFVDNNADDGEPIGLSDEVKKSLLDKADVLTKKRKTRGKRLPEELASQDDIRRYTTSATHSGLHSASTPGILCIDLSNSRPERIITGGADKTAVVFDNSSEQIVTTLKGHSKKVTSVIYHPTEDVAITASPDSTIRVWNANNGSCSSIIKTHKAAVTGLSLHALGDYVLSSSEDRHWAFSDINSGKTFCRVTDNQVDSALTCTQFHPDGLILGTGHEDSQIKIWDLKSGDNVANFPGHSGPVVAMSFSENGYYLATGADDTTVKLWDLRKLKNFKTLVMEEVNGRGYQVKSLKFDQSGTYLSVAGSDVRVFLSKQWQELTRFTDHEDVCTDVVFGKDAQFIASTSMDRKLKIYR